MLKVIVRSLTTVFILLGICTAAPVGNNFTYQGHLRHQGAEANGLYDFAVGLFDVATGGSPIAAALAMTNTPVVDGVFSIDLDFGLLPATGDARWLEIRVRESGSGDKHTLLLPRQEIRPTPYALSLVPGAETSTSVADFDAPFGVVTIRNEYDGVEISDPAAPALHLVGEIGLELASPTNDNATIYSDRAEPSSDLFMYSNDNVQIYLDRNNDEDGVFAVIGTPGICQIVGGDLSCSGTKSASVAVGDQQRLVYAMESPEVWFEDFGQARLNDGAARVSIEALFGEATDLSEYHVFLTPLGDCQGLYVTEKTNTGFEVREFNSGRSDTAFDYRVVAHRAGHSERRFEPDDVVH